MKASASISTGDWYKSVDVELDSTSESDVKFAKTVLSTIAEIKEAPKKITLDVYVRPCAVPALHQCCSSSLSRL